MDIEPGRCRRTDGKKWRCHQSVIPNEKYCAKHMHRGSKRSRKLVEVSPYSESPNPIRCRFPTTLDNNVMITPLGLTDIIVKSNVNENDKQFEFMEASLYSRNPNFIKCKLPDNLDNVGPTSVMIQTPFLTNAVVESNEKREQKNQSQRELAANDRIAVMNLASELDFSPKRALQNGRESLKSEFRKSTSESESRCNRTYRKSCWCEKEVVPDYNFCAQHLSRRKVCTGKPSLGPLPSSEAQILDASTFSAKFSRKEQGKIGLSLAADSNLRASLPSWLADLNNVKDNMAVAQDGCSSSSSEATETDEEITGVWDVGNHSP